MSIKSDKILNTGQLVTIGNRLNDLKGLRIPIEHQKIKFHFETLGAATYIHYMGALADRGTIEAGKVGETAYYRKASQYNPILVNNFDWLYKLIQNYFSIKFGSDVLIADQIQLAVPGFHFFYTYSGCEYPSHPCHMDLQHEVHIPRLTSLFNNVSVKNIFTFILSIKHPASGAGIFFWNFNEDMSLNYEDEKAKNRILEDKVDSLILKNTNFLDFNEIMKPNIVNYEPGTIYYFRGILPHQIQPFKGPFNFNDERITMQGHGIKCDGIWYLYF